MNADGPEEQVFGWLAMRVLPPEPRGNDPVIELAARDGDWRVRLRGCQQDRLKNVLRGWGRGVVVAPDRLIAVTEALTDEGCVCAPGVVCDARTVGRSRSTGRRRGLVLIHSGH